MLQIADFHCDLLSYLSSDSTRTAYDAEAKASIPQLKAGGVELQTMAIYTKTEKGSAQQGENQAKIFFDLNEIPMALAIENASSFCEEDEPLEKGLRRLEGWLERVGKIAYISLTWNEENRFGGGNATDIGLKPDGLELLQWMEGKKIAIDLSHTSNRLADEILERIQTITPIASHSNFRAVEEHPRNLPDRLAKEIGARRGLIGLNFVRKFVGKDPEDLLRHVEHAERLGLLDALCFGADFFSDTIASPELEHLKPFFFPGFDDASCYPKVTELFLKYLPRDTVEKISFNNLSQFL